MASAGPISNIKTIVDVARLKGAFPSGATRTLLAKVLEEFVKTTSADLKWVDVKDNGVIKDIKTFVKIVDQANDLPKALLLQAVCKNSTVISKEVLPKVQKYLSDLKCYSGALPVRIVLDLAIAQAKQAVKNKIADELPDLQNISSGTSVSDAVDTATTVFKYSEPFIYKMLMRLGYLAE